MGHVVMTSELAGVPETAVFAMDDASAWDARQRAVLPFARKMTLRPAEIERSDVDALRPHLTDPQIVELCLAICRYNTMNRLADAFGVPLERENPFAPPPDSTPPTSKPASPGPR